MVDKIRKRVFCDVLATSGFVRPSLTFGGNEDFGSCRITWNFIVEKKGM
jgi:hypothetical protein